MGRWKNIEIDYQKDIENYCTLCGAILLRRFWVNENKGKELNFCNPECERLFKDYWLPKYGKKS
jgi:DNA phosphorothioation-dependent restriction protein DptG